MAFLRPSGEGLKKAFTLGKTASVKELSSSVAEKVKESNKGVSIDELGKYSWRYCFNKDYEKYLKEFGIKDNNIEVVKEVAEQRSKGYFLTMGIFIILGVFGNIFNESGFLATILAFSSILMATIFFWQGIVMRWHYLVNRDRKMIPLTHVFGEKLSPLMILFCPARLFKMTKSSQSQ